MRKKAAAQSGDSPGFWDRTKDGTFPADCRLKVAFFRSASGDEPVLSWLRSLPSQDRQRIGEELRTVQLGWPLGMPLVRKMEQGLWEARVTLPGRIARILFTVSGKTMVLLHGFIKKSPRTPGSDLQLARARMKAIYR